MKLYAVTMIAQRGSDLRIKPGIGLAISDEDAHERGRQAAFVALPTDEGFTDHQIVCVAIPQHLELEGYCLDWQVGEL